MHLLWSPAISLLANTWATPAETFSLKHQVCRHKCVTWSWWQFVSVPHSGESEHVSGLKQRRETDLIYWWNCRGQLLSSVGHMKEWTLLVGLWTGCTWTDLKRHGHTCKNNDGHGNTWKNLGKSGQHGQTWMDLENVDRPGQTQTGLDRPRQTGTELYFTSPPPPPLSIQPPCFLPPFISDLKPSFQVKTRQKSETAQSFLLVHTFSRKLCSVARTWFSVCWLLVVILHLVCK